MAKVIGLGGVFLRAGDPDALLRWYEQHLGIQKSPGGYALPPPAESGGVVFAVFKQDNAYFPVEQKAMLNLQVDDLHAVLDRLQAEGVAVDPKRDSYDFGKFGWFTDPEGNRVELWEPVLSGTAADGDTP